MTNPYIEALLSNPAFVKAYEKDISNGYGFHNSLMAEDAAEIVDRITILEQNKTRRFREVTARDLQNT